MKKNFDQTTLVRFSFYVLKWGFNVIYIPLDNKIDVCMVVSKILLMYLYSPVKSVIDFYRATLMLYFNPDSHSIAP